MKGYLTTLSSSLQVGGKNLQDLAKQLGTTTTKAAQPAGGLQATPSATHRPGQGERGWACWDSTAGAMIHHVRPKESRPQLLGNCTGRPAVPHVRRLRQAGVGVGVGGGGGGVRVWPGRRQARLVSGSPCLITLFVARSAACQLSAC